MTIQIKHAFTSLKGDGTDATQVQPSNWNAAHSTSIASGNLVGRLSAGAGVFEEIPVSAYMAGLLAAADKNALAALLGVFETGDIKYTFKNAAATGWLLLTSAAAASNTIGNGGSGAILRANADCLALYTVVYNTCADAQAPVSGGRTGNATNDFNAGKTISIPPLVGYSPIGAGGGFTGITTKVIGAAVGTETVQLVTANLPAYTPAGTITNGAITTNITGGAGVGSGGAWTAGGGTLTTVGLTATSTQAPSTFAGTPQGGTSSPVSLFHPSRGMNVMVKL